MGHKVSNLLRWSTLPGKGLKDTFSLQMSSWANQAVL